MAARPVGRFILLALAFLSLLAAMWAGLLRLGWPLPRLAPTLVGQHGLLMTAGFLGALISLERAVALEYRWPYAAPLLFGMGAVLGLVLPFVGALLITAGSAIMVAIYVDIIRQHLAAHSLLMLLGALCLLVASGLWLAGRAAYEVALWWAAFPVLTVVGERLELSRLLRIALLTRSILLLIVGAFVAGLVLATAYAPALGVQLLGVALVGQGLWLLRNDIARRSLGQTGLPRFMAVCLIAGEAWLVIGGALAVLSGRLVSGTSYDAVLHALLLGFVFSMIFGHAPIILPAVLHLPLAFQSLFYVHLALLHISLVMRIVGDLALLPALRQWGGMLNVIAILLFLANTMRAMLLARRAVRPRPGAG